MAIESLAMEDHQTIQALAMDGYWITVSAQEDDGDYIYTVFVCEVISKSVGSVIVTVSDTILFAAIEDAYRQVMQVRKER